MKIQNDFICCSILDHNSRVVIDELRASKFNGELVSTHDIEELLASNGITKNIHWDKIESSIKSMQKPTDILKDIEIASISYGKIELLDKKTYIERQSIINIRKQLENVRRFYFSERPYLISDKIIFVKENARFLTITPPDYQDVYGQKIPEFDFIDMFKCDNLITKLYKGKEIIYKALANGYLFINNEDKLDIMPIEEISDDRLKLFLCVCKADLGDDCLRATVENIIINKKINMDHERIYKALDKREYSRLLIATGIPAKPSKPAELKFLYNQNENLQNESHSCNYREKNKFTEVFPDQCLATQKILNHGLEGLGVDGEPIEVTKVESRKHKPPIEGNNVYKTVDVNKNIHYFSKIQGIVYFENNKFSVEELLTINGDVGLETGNLNYGKDILIKGVVTSQSHIHCGGNLTIEKIIENNVEINCNGNCTVLRGVFGNETKLVIEGNCTLKNIQDATILCSGNVTILQYSHNAKIYAKGNINILGRSKNNDSHSGAAVGGVINSLKSIELHSVGSNSNPSFIAAGVDLQLEEKCNEIKSLIHLTYKKIIHIQNDLPFEINQCSIEKYTQTLTTEQKKQLKDKIIELKQHLDHFQQLKEQFRNLRNELNLEDSIGTKISVLNQLVPDVTIRISESETSILKKMHQCKFKLEDKNIIQTQL